MPTLAQRRTVGGLVEVALSKVIPGDILAILNALRTAFPPKVLSDY